MASVGSSLALLRVSTQMRLLFGNVGSVQNQDALVAQDLDTVSEEEDFEAWVAHRLAKRAKRESGDGGSSGSAPFSDKGKVKDATNRRTGGSTRRFICNSEYRCATQRPRKGSKSGIDWVD